MQLCINGLSLSAKHAFSEKICGFSVYDIHIPYGFVGKFIPEKYSYARN